MAVLLAPAGVGVISQAFSFFTAVSTVTSLGLGAGIIKYIAIYREEKNSLLIRQVILVSFLLQILISLLSIIAVFYFGREISFLIFSIAGYSKLLILVVLAVPLTTMVYLITSVFLSIGNVKAFTASRAWGYLTGVIPMVLLIYFWGIKGGFIQILVVALISFLFCLYYFTKVMPKEYYLSQNPIEFKGLFLTGRTIFKYGFIMLSSTAFASFSLLAIRSLIVHRLGNSVNGYYQVLVALSACYLPFFTNALWSHFYPRASSQTSSVELSKELSDTVRFLSIGITGVIVLVLTVKRYLVMLIFSSKFISALPFMQSQLVGDFFALLSMTLACSVLARGKVKIYFINALFANLIFFILSAFTLRHFGLFSVTLSYILAQFVSFTFIYLYHVNYLKLPLSEGALKAILSSLALFIIIILLPDTFIGSLLKILTLLLWSFAVVKKSEWQAIISLAGEKWKKLTYQLAE